MKCYYCGKELSERDMVIKPIPLTIKNGQVRNYKRKFHYECLPKFMAGREDIVERKKEDTDWDRVYKYFKFDVLGIPESNRLPEHAVQRLLGLRVGKYKPNATNTRAIKQGYSFETIYYTLMFCKKTGKFDYALTHVDFADEHHRIDYLMKIVVDQIAFINQRVKKKHVAEKQADKIKDEVVHEEVQAAPYKRKGRGKRKAGL